MITRTWGWGSICVVDSGRLEHHFWTPQLIYTCTHYQPQMSTSHTFTLTHNGKPVTPWQYQSYSYRTPGPERITLQGKLKQRMLMSKHGAQLLAHTNPVNSADSGMDSSFPACIYEAYNHHLHLILRPDDLWVSIMIVFANYVSFHSEALRDVLVPFSGVRDVVVTHQRTDDIGDWLKIIQELADSAPMKEGVKEWMLPSFSTTTQKDLAVAQLALLGSMKRYTNFHSNGACGIPEVTLKGTVADWIDLRERCTRIGVYGHQSKLEELGWWCDLLLDIVDQFIVAREGHPDNDFWQRCVHPDGACGAGVQGWVLAFSPFEEGNWRLNHPKDIKLTHNYGSFTNVLAFNNYATIQVPVNVHCHDEDYVAYLYGGAILSSIDETTHTIYPNFDLAVLRIPQATMAKMDQEQAKEFVPKAVLSELDRLHAETGLPISVTSKHHVHPVQLNRIWYCEAHKAEVGHGTIGYHCYQCGYRCCAKCAQQ